MAFDNQHRLRELTDTEMYEVAGDRRVILMQAARAAVMKKGE
jgi:hypothetical protein